MVLEIARTVLDGLGYRVLAANSPKEALRLATETGEKIDLLITDIVMPEMNGRDLVERLTSRFKGLKSLYISGYTPDFIAPRGVLPEGSHFLQKPFPLKDLATRVREVLEAS
jgi:CheY-like chemotaxis protein